MSVDRLTRVGENVRSFYEEYCFPGYEEFETPFDLVEKSRKGIYARLLDEQLPLGVKILDAGCGTGQLAVFLSMTHRTVFGVDFSSNSLKKANDFKRRFRLGNVKFAQMDIFNLGLADESFDYVFCNGALHHTGDAYRGFQCLCRLVKQGGYLIIGLYNKYGRVMLNLRRLIFKVSGGRLKSLDYFMRQKSLGVSRRRIWYMDQYRNPYETSFSIGDVLGWFSRNGIEYVNSIPKINLAERLTDEEKLFDGHDVGTRFDHLFCQLGWMFTRGHEGGLFIMIGRKAR